MLFRSQRFVGAVRPEIDFGEIAEQAVIVGLQRARRLHEIDCTRVLFGRKGDQAEMMQCVRVGRFFLEHRTVSGFGFGQPPRAMMLESARERGADCVGTCGQLHAQRDFDTTVWNSPTDIATLMSSALPPVPSGPYEVSVNAVWLNTVAGAIGDVTSVY